MVRPRPFLMIKSDSKPLILIFAVVHLNSSRHRSISLSDTLLASARNVRDVLAGRSLSDSLAATPAELRASAQAVSFHAMRKLGQARHARRILVSRKPPNPLFDALLLVSLALLETAVEHEAQKDEQAQKDEPAARHLPVYAVHTVVDQAVTAVSAQPKMRAYKALLNGTLRNYIRERNAILTQAKDSLEARFNFPDWWVRRLGKAYPEQWEALLKASDEPGPMTLRVNARRTTVQGMLDALDASGMPAFHRGGDAITLRTPSPVQDIPGFDQGWFSVQDYAAQQAGVLLPLTPGMRVLDACAAPGGKTAHLLERADLSLLAIDADAARLGRVRENLARLGLDRGDVSLKQADAAELESWWDGVPFDAILADVPCTASGVVRRHPDIRWLRREADIAKTSALQRRIVDALWCALRPGGHLLYATCSIFPEECEEQAQHFQHRHADALRLEAPGQMLPLAERPIMAHDGFFYALFAKRA